MTPKPVGPAQWLRSVFRGEKGVSTAAVALVLPLTLVLNGFIIEGAPLTAERGMLQDATGATVVHVATSLDVLERGSRDAIPFVAPMPYETDASDVAFSTDRSTSGAATRKWPYAIAEADNAARPVFTPLSQVTGPIGTTPRVPAGETTAVTAPAAAVKAATAAPTAPPKLSGSPSAAQPIVAATPEAPLLPSRGSEVPAPVAPLTLANNNRAGGLLNAMNRERAAEGLSTLTPAADLASIAHLRSTDMVEQKYFAHVSPEGTSWITLVSMAGIRLSAGGENLARVSGDDARSVEVAITHLMASATHRANILNRAYTEVGVAAVTDSDGVTVFTTILAAR